MEGCLQCFGGGACSVLEGCAIFGGALQCFGGGACSVLEEGLAVF